MNRIGRTSLVVRAGWAAALLLATVAAGPPARGKVSKEADLPPLNRKVVDFARGHLGEKVGNGQCTKLAQLALESAGASRSRYKEANADYAWGLPVASFKEALPGDILQFRDAVFDGKRSLGKSRVSSWHAEYLHHTAVVEEVREGGKAVVVLHQNVGLEDAPAEVRQVVRRDTIRVHSLKRGTVWIYRPVAGRPEG